VPQPPITSRCVMTKEAVSDMNSWTSMRFEEIDDNPDANADAGSDKKEPVSDRLSDDPTVMDRLNAIKRSLFSLENDYRDSLAKQLALAADVASSLKRDFFLWNDFIDSNWNDVQKPKLSDQRDALRHVLRWLCGPTRAGKQKASFYFRAVSPLVQKGLRGSKLEKKLRKKGVKVLAAQHAAESRSEREENEIIHQFAPKGKQGPWRVRLDVEFDRKPEELFGLAGEPTFTLRGAVQKLDGKQSRMWVLGYSFALDD